MQVKTKNIILIVFNVLFVIGAVVMPVCYLLGVIPWESVMYDQSKAITLSLSDITDDSVHVVRYTSPPADNQNAHREYEPVVSILFTGMGLSYTTTQASLATLPKIVALGFSPYGSSSNYWGEIAEQKGHDVLLHIPMEEIDESIEGDAQGPLSLTTKQTVRENEEKFKSLLGSMDKLHGVYFLGDSKYQLSKDHVQSSAIMIRKKNLMIACEHEPFAALSNFADATGIPVVVSQFWLDNTLTESAIRYQLNSIEQAAKKKGPIMVLAHPYPLTIKLVNEWINKEGNNVEIIPLTSLIQRIKILEDAEADGE